MIVAGCSVTFGGALTFNNGDAIRDAAARVPEMQLMVETDSPYMAPKPLRGEVCEPAMVVFTVSALADVRGAEGEERLRVSLIDYGAKRNITRELQKRGCTVTVLPATVSAEEVLEAHPDGIMLSNGPGDPAENVYQIAQIQKFLGKVPLFGICLGHQLTALAAGGKTYKLKYGHRGVNQPVKEVNGVRTYITSQNHGYAVDGESIQAGTVSFVNANDGTCEGIDYPGLSAFTVQFHPEACTGPKDTGFLFDRFVEMMKGGRA